MSNDSNIQAMLTDIQKVLEATHTIVNGMQPGERKQIKQLAEDVSAVVGRNTKEVLGYVNDYAHRIESANIAYVTRGKNGGLIRGTRPAKVVKPKKVKTDTSSSDS